MAVGLVRTFYVRFDLLVCARARERRLVDEMFGLLMVELFLANFHFSFLVRDFVLNEMLNMVVETFENFVFFVVFS
jgi:hypothetical protein